MLSKKSRKTLALTLGLSIVANVLPTVVMPKIAYADSGAPTLGEKHMTQSDTDSGMMLTWQKATDNKTPQNKLRYYLYQSENKNYGDNNVSDWEKNAKLLNEGGTLDLSEWKLTGLKDDSTYNFKIIVEDEDGNKTEYGSERRDIRSVTKDVGDKEKFAKAKAKALEFMSTYKFTTNMYWPDFTNALGKELSAYGITGVGDSGASVDKNTGVVTASIFLYMDKGERYIFPFSGKASDVNNVAQNNSQWNQNADKTWKLIINGQAAIGWKQVDSKWYYLNQSGIMQTGWFKDTDGKWYFLKSDGAMALNENVGGYYINANGVWVS